MIEFPQLTDGNVRWLWPMREEMRKWLMARWAEDCCLDLRQTRFLVELGFLPLVASLAESPKVLNRVFPAFRDWYDVIYFQCNLMVT